MGRESWNQDLESVVADVTVPLSDTWLGMAGGKPWTKSVKKEGRGKRRQKGSKEAWADSIGLMVTHLSVAQNMEIRAIVPVLN